MAGLVPVSGEGFGTGLSASPVNCSCFSKCSSVLWVTAAAWTLMLRGCGLGHGAGVRAVDEMDAREDRNEEMLKTHCIDATMERESGPW